VDFSHQLMHLQHVLHVTKVIIKLYQVLRLVFNVQVVNFNRKKHSLIVRTVVLDFILIQLVKLDVNNVLRVHLVQIKMMVDHRFVLFVHLANTPTLQDLQSVWIVLLEHMQISLVRKNVPHVRLVVIHCNLLRYYVNHADLERFLWVREQFNVILARVDDSLNWRARSPVMHVSLAHIRVILVNQVV